MNAIIPSKYNPFYKNIRLLYVVGTAILSSTLHIKIYTIDTSYIVKNAKDFRNTDIIKNRNFFVIFGQNVPSERELKFYIFAKYLKFDRNRPFLTKKI